MDPTGSLQDLIDRTLPQLRIFVRALLGTRLRRKDTVSDVVQSAFREVLHDLGNEPLGESALRARLFKAADRKVIEHARKFDAEKRAVDRERPITEARALASLTCDPSELAELRDDVERLMSALDRLPDVDREVVVLGSILGLSHARIAAHLGLSELATRSRLSRALARLATQLRRP